MTYEQMRGEDEQAHEDGMAIAAGTMCRFCLSVMHVANRWEDCPRENRPMCADCFYYLDTNKHQDGCPTGERVHLLELVTGSKPDFICSHCNKPKYWPHEGSFIGNVEPEILCIDCSLRERGIID